MKDTIFAETDRLILRNVQLSDVDQLLEYAGNPSVVDMMNGSIPLAYTHEIATKWVLKHANDTIYSQSISWGIILKTSNTLIGSIQLRLDESRKTAYLSYWVGKPYWNQGIATEAGKCVIEFGFTKIILEKIEAEHFRRNPASGQVLLKLGFQHIGSVVKQEGLAKRLEHFEQYSHHEAACKCTCFL